MSTILASRRAGDQIAIPGDYQYRSYHGGWAAQRYWHHAKFAEAARWLTPAAADVVLDAGCGSGVLADRLAADPNTRVLGIDANAAAIEFAQQKFRRPNLEFRLGFLHELELPDESIDKIAFLEVIEHLDVEQASTVLSAFRRLLRPGGRLVITTPNERSLWPVIEWTLDRLRLVPHLADDQHVALYDSRSLVQLGESLGFRCVTMRTLNLLAPWIATLSWRLAETMHRLEQSRPHLYGSLLLAIFQK